MNTCRHGYPVTDEGCDEHLDTLDQLEIGWDELREAWVQDEIRRGKDAQLSLLTDAGTSGKLDEQLSLDRATDGLESFQPQGRTASGESAKRSKRG